MPHDEQHAARLPALLPRAEKHIRQRKTHIRQHGSGHAATQNRGGEVDLVEEQTIKNPFLKKNVDAAKALIYG